MSETDMTDYNELREEKAATPHNELIAQLLDSRVPKSEREHAAAREIERLREEVVALQAEIDALRTRLEDTVRDSTNEIEALRGLEEREQRDEALLRQALDALELRCGTHADERKDLIPALRERLGEGGAMIYAKETSNE